MKKSILLIFLLALPFLSFAQSKGYGSKAQFTVLTEVRSVSNFISDAQMESYDWTVSPGCTFANGLSLRIPLDMAMLEEILELSRTNQKILRSPDVILLPDYLEYIFRERLNSHLSDKDRDSIEEQHRLSIDIKHKYLQLMDMLDMYRSDGRYIDEDLNMNIRGFMDLVRHQQVLLERLYRTYRW